MAEFALRNATLDDAMQLKTKLNNEVHRLHHDTQERHGHIEINEREAAILLALVSEYQAEKWGRP